MLSSQVALEKVNAGYPRPAQVYILVLALAGPDLQQGVILGLQATAEELAQQAGTIAKAAGAVDSTSGAALTTTGRGQAAAAEGVIAQGLAETQQYTGQVDEARRSMKVILRAVEWASDMAQQIRQTTQEQTQASYQVTAPMREVAAALDVARTEGAAVSTAAVELLHLAADLRRVNAGSAAANGHAAG